MRGRSLLLYHHPPSQARWSDKREGDFKPQGHWAMSGDVLVMLVGEVLLGAAGIWWVETKGAAMHPTMHRTEVYSKEGPVQASAVPRRRQMLCFSKQPDESHM